LRGLGSVNFHIASTAYGEVEVAHQTLAHALSDATLEQTVVFNGHILSDKSGDGRRARGPGSDTCWWLDER
jgi:hypothetical protein